MNGICIQSLPVTQTSKAGILAISVMVPYEGLIPGYVVENILNIIPTVNTKVSAYWVSIIQSYCMKVKLLHQSSF